MKIQTKSIENSIIYICIILALIGVLLIGNIGSFQFNSQDFLKQLIWMGISAIFFVIFYYTNLDKMRRLAFPLLIVGLLLLVAVLIPRIGVCINNSYRRINLGPFGFQPSTVARFILIFYLVHFLGKNRNLIEQSKPLQFVKNFLPIIIALILYTILIFIEPDLSTAAILFMVWLSILFVARINFSTIFLIGLLAVLLGVLALQLGPEYRRARYISFYRFNSGELLSEDDEKYIYQPRESLVAMSHGELTGRGSSQGRAKLFYLPFAKTDYIFAILGEESGFIGSTILVILYLALIFGGLTLAQRTDNFFYALLIAGFTFNLAYNVIVNIGVVTSLIPSTGVSLPFISYGGSALLVDSISVAIIINASRRAVPESI
jgi:cell division protein FtsW (lipid II flippase)